MPRIFFSSMLFLTLAAACAAAEGAPSAAPGAAASLDRARADSLDRFIGALVSEGLVPGLSIAVVRGDAAVYLRGFGVRDVETRQPVTPETGFYIASSTKSFTGTLAAVLAERGEIGLDAPLSRALPDLELRAPLSADSLTLRALLTHQGKIANDGVVFRTAYTGDHTPEALVRVLGESTPLERPFQYTNLGYVMAGLAMERAAGAPWQDLLRREIFAPLGMTRTTARVSEAAAWPLASPHTTRPDGPARIPFLKNDETMHAAGGMLTTAADLARWLEANLNGGRVDGRQAIPAAALRAAHQPYAFARDTFYRFERTGYGLGWWTSSFEGERLVHHFGSFAGWHAHVSFMPERGLGVAVLANDVSAGAFFVPHVVASYAYELLLGKPGLEAKYAEELRRLRENRDRYRTAVREDQERRAARPPTPAERKPFFAGTYESPTHGTMTIRLGEDGELRASVGALSAPLTPFTRPDALRVEFIPGSGQPLLFLFPDDRSPADSLRYADTVWRRVESRAER